MQFIHISKVLKFIYAENIDKNIIDICKVNKAVCSTCNVKNNDKIPQTCEQNLKQESRCEKHKCTRVNIRHINVVQQNEGKKTDIHITVNLITEQDLDDDMEIV